MEPVKTLLLFHDNDLPCADRVRLMLKPLIKNRFLEIMDPPKSDGSNVEDQMVRQVLDSQLILFVISADLFDDDFLTDKLLRKSIRQASDGYAVLVPIFYNNCLWQLSELYHFNRYPKQPIYGFEKTEDGYYEVSLGIMDIAKNFKQQLKNQKKNFELQRNLINTFNFYEQINDHKRQQFKEHNGWCKVCLLQGNAKSGLNILGWRIRTELADIPNDAPRTIRAINLENTRDLGPEGISATICDNMFGQLAKSISELAALLWQHLQNECYILYLNNLQLLDSQPIAVFFTELYAAWSALKGSSDMPEPPNSFWCFLTYEGEDALHLQIGSNVLQYEFPKVKTVASSDFDKWMECCTITEEKKNDLLNAQEYILGEKDENNVKDVLMRLCETLGMKTILYDEHIEKLDIP